VVRDHTGVRGTNGFLQIGLSAVLVSHQIGGPSFIARHFVIPAVIPLRRMLR
jgi:hypothetical protein